jgi:hypothetical protein
MKTVILFVSLMWFATASYAQMPFFIEDFEGDTSAWTFDNSTFGNRWYVGTAIKKDGERSAYISYDGGAHAGYNTEHTSYVSLYRYVTFPDAPSYAISFDWRGGGETFSNSFEYSALCGYQDFLDYLYVSISGASFNSCMNFAKNAGWKHEYKTTTSSLSGTPKKVAFVFQSDQLSGVSYGEAIDNVILYKEVVVNTTYAVGLTLDSIAIDSIYTWKSPTTGIAAGNGQKFAAIYTDTLGRTAEGTITVSVAKAAGAFTPLASGVALYKSGLYLSNIPLPAGYQWKNSSRLVSSSGLQRFAATYTDPSGNYAAAEDSVAVNVVTPTAGATYAAGLTLADIALPEGLAWANPLTLLAAGVRENVGVKYADLRGDTVGGYFTVSVAKAAGAFTPDTVAVIYRYGLQLINISLPDSYKWKSNRLVNAGSGQRFTATYTDPSGNYNPVDGDIVVNIAKAAGTFVAPSPINVGYTASLTLAGVALPAYYAWADSATVVNADNGQRFTAIYTDPSGNYEEAEGQVTVNAASGATSVTSPSANELKLYPNPTGGVVYVDLIETIILVYSVDGKPLQRTFGKSVDLSTYPNGVYVLRIKDKTAKIVKQ